MAHEQVGEGRAPCGGGERWLRWLVDRYNWKVVYGDVQGHPHQFLLGLGVTSVKLGLEVKARYVAQTMMADDWAGLNTSEESVQAQWRMWVDYALAAGSPIGVAGLEKTVITAATFHKGKWVDIPVKLKVPKDAGGMVDLPDYVPQMRVDDAYLPTWGFPGQSAETGSS